jgi:hypothetical protein
MRWNQRGCRLQYGGAFRAGLARLLARKRTPASLHPHPHARTHTHTHTEKYVRLIALPWQQWLPERATVLCYTYIASHVNLGATDRPMYF